jgi:hypothetical protein
MFTKSFPASGDELAARMSESLQRLFVLSGEPVTVRAPEYPKIDAIHISLDGAQLRNNPPRPVVAAHAGGQRIDVAKLKMSGRGISLVGSSVDFELTATDVRLVAADAANGEIVLVARAAASGRVQAGASKAAIESLITQVAKREAGAHGVAIESVRLNVQQRDARSVAGEVKVRARKLFLSANISITGRLDVDDKLNARISGLRCDGDGAIAKLACGVLDQHLRKLDGREFSLMALPLGEIRLRDVQLAVGDQISVAADFGAA